MILFDNHVFLFAALLFVQRLMQVTCISIAVRTQEATMRGGRPVNRLSQPVSNACE